MLQAIHDKITGWIAAIVIGIIGITFVFWGIDVGFGSVSYAAAVEGHEWPFWKPAEKVSLQEVGQIYQNQISQYQQMTRSEVPEEIKAGMQKQLIDAVVRRELIEQHANALGYRVREEDINRSIESEPAFQVAGRFSEEAAKRMLDAQGISRRAFREDLRRQLQVTQLQRAIEASAFVTPAELERVRRLEEQEREISWVAIDPTTLTVPEPEEAAIAAYYEQNKAGYMTPDTVRLQYVELRLADIEPTVSVNEDELRAEYESTKERYVSEERRRSRHILVKIEGSDESAARRKADEILAKAQAPGADFARLAREHSEDAGSAQEGGDLGWLEREFLAPQYSDALFAMKEGEVRGPVRSEFGYHIIRLEGIDAGDQKSFEEVRGDLEAEYRTAQAEKVFGERQENLAEKAFESIDSLEAAASSIGSTVRTVADFRRDSGGGPFANNRAVIDAAFSDSVLGGQNSEPIEIDPGYLVVVRSEDRKPPEQKPLAAVRAEIVAAVKQQRAEELARSRGEEALAKLQSGTPWATVVADLKASAQGPKYFRRTDPEILAGLRQPVFLAPKPAGGRPVFQGVTMPDGGYGLFSLTNVRTEAPAESAQQVRERSNALAGRLARNEVTSYVEELRRRANVSVNPRAFE